MFDKDNIQHNLKTGADSDLVFTREITGKRDPNINKLVLVDGIRKYPYLARTTGNSFKGTTEQITSNELRKGRTKSAPRQGNSSAEGSLEFELSPTTFDDNLEAVFRNTWKEWKSDTDSAINLDYGPCLDGYFITRCTEEGEKNYNGKEAFGTRKLLSEDGGLDGGLIAVPKGCVVHELTCGTEDIKYSVLRKMGGVAGEDLYQEFKHMAINSLNLDMQIGAIVTGSFDFMGNNNPKLLDDAAIRKEFGGAEADRFADGVTTGDKYIDNLPVKATNTDQFTTREGDLWINGKNITFAESLSFALNNGLEKKFALFVKNAISTQPLSLDITGNLQTYVVAGESDELYNLGVDDATNEIMFALEDKEVNPSFIYVFQIFKTKFSDQDISMSGADTISQNHPWNSFEERAARVFRIALPKPLDIDFVPAEQWTQPGKYIIRPNVELSSVDMIKDGTLTCQLKDEQGKPVGDPQVIKAATLNPETKMIEVTESPYSSPETAVLREVTLSFNGETITHAFLETDKPDPATASSTVPEDSQLTVNWTDSASPDVDHYDLEAVTGSEKPIKATVKQGIETYIFKKLKNDNLYNITIVAVDKRGNRSTAEKTSGTPAVQLP